MVLPGEEDLFADELILSGSRRNTRRTGGGKKDKKKNKKTSKKNVSSRRSEDDEETLAKKAKKAKKKNKLEKAKAEAVISERMQAALKAELARVYFEEFARWVVERIGPQLTCALIPGIQSMTTRWSRMKGAAVGTTTTIITTMTTLSDMAAAVGSRRVVPVTERHVPCDSGDCSHLVCTLHCPGAKAGRCMCPCVCAGTGPLTLLWHLSVMLGTCPTNCDFSVQTVLCHETCFNRSAVTRCAALGAGSTSPR